MVDGHLAGVTVLVDFATAYTYVHCGRVRPGGMFASPALPRGGPRVTAGGGACTAPYTGPYGCLIKASAEPFATATIKLPPPTPPRDLAAPTTGKSCAIIVKTG